MTVPSTALGSHAFPQMALASAKFEVVPAPVGTVAITVSVAVSITETVRSSTLLTRTRPSASLFWTEAAFLPTGID